MRINPNFGFPEIIPTEIDGVKLKDKIIFSLDCGFQLTYDREQIRLIPWLGIEFFEKGAKDPIFTKNYEFDDVLELGMITPVNATIEVDRFTGGGSMECLLARTLMGIHAKEAKFAVEANLDGDVIKFYLRIGQYESTVSIPESEVHGFIRYAPEIRYGDAVDIE